jgi:hypothetical protein
MLAQQASGYDVGGCNFHIQKQPMHEDLYFCRVSAEASAKPTALASLADPDSLASQSAWMTLPVGLVDSPVASPVNVHDELSNRPSKTSSDVGADLYDWRTPLLAYLRDPSAKVDKSVRRSAFKYVLHNDEIYQRTVEDLLLKCLETDQARIAMGEVHKGICGTHQSAMKMKWLLRRAGFY